MHRVYDNSSHLGSFPRLSFNLSSIRSSHNRWNGCLLPIPSVGHGADGRLRRVNDDHAHGARPLSRQRFHVEGAPTPLHCREHPAYSDLLSESQTAHR